MTNPYPSGTPYSNSTASSRSNFRRSSYASVAAGAASASHSHAPIGRPGALSQLLRSEELDAQRERSRSSLNTSPSIPTMALPKGPGSSGIEKTWAAFGHSDWSLADDMPTPIPDFVCPSYLRSSRYAERLAEEHRLSATAARESRRSGTQRLHSTKDNPSSASLSTSSSGANLHNNLSNPPPSYARNSAHDHIEHLPPLNPEDGLKKLPSVWSDTDKCPGLDILNGGTEVKLSARTNTTDDNTAAAVRSDYPMPKELGLYYFEVTILSRGKEGLIGIGFSSPKVVLHRLPGWEPDSWAYHGDDGYSFAGTHNGKQYGPKFSSLDVIGCGVNFKSGSAFFTKNGQYIGEAFHNIKADKLYPSVGMKKQGEHLRVNFGATPFVFDIDIMMENERAKVRDEIARTSVATLQPPLEERALIQELIAQYLAHDGYVETARAFADDVHSQRQSLSGSSQPLKMFDPSQDAHATNRQRIRAAILDGDIDQALTYINTYYSHVLERVENRDVYFKLRCRKFIEMMRRSTELGNNTGLSTITSKAFGKLSQKNTTGLDGQFHRESACPTIPPISVPAPLDPSLLSSGNGFANDSMDTSPDPLKPISSQNSSQMSQSSLLTEALNYGRELSREFSGDTRPAVKQALKDTFALLAYTDARESVVGGLMEGKGRVEIAEEVNAAILVSLGKPSSAALEKLCAQAEVLVDMLGADGGSGAFVNVGKDCLQA